MRMYNQLVLLFALALAGCGGGNTPTPQPPGPSGFVTISMNPASWQFQYSPNMPSNPSSAAQGWQFDFPNQDGVHYLTQAVSGKLGYNINATFQVQQSGSVQFVESNPCPPQPMNAKLRLYFQRRGDNMSGAVGTYEFYRWFSVEGFVLSDTGTGFSVPVTPSLWNSVWGKRGDDPSATAGFNAAINDVQTIGVTFGGCFAGHGVYVTGGDAKLTMSNFVVQ